MPRLAVLHTVSALAERFKPMFRDALGDKVDAFHMVDESLLQDVMRRGPGPSITRRIVSFAETADGRMMVTLEGVCRFRIVREAEGIIQGRLAGMVGQKTLQPAE